MSNRKLDSDTLAEVLAALRDMPEVTVAGGEYNTEALVGDQVADWLERWAKDRAESNSTHFVFVDTEFYPYVADPVEAPDPHEALRVAVEREAQGHFVGAVHVVPIDLVLSEEVRR